MTEQPKTDKNLEQVFVTKNNPSLHFAPEGVDYIHIAPMNEAWCEEAIEGSSFVPRWLAEKDKTILQLIPYVICIDSNGKLLSYSRKGGGEGRLEGKKSIGIGGHVNDGDKPKKTRKNTWNTVLIGAARELAEELNMDPVYAEENLVQVGTIFTPTDGETPKTTTTPKVGEVHLGIIYLLEVPDDVMVCPSEGMINSKFVSPKPRDLKKYEYWSRLIFKNLDKIKELSHDTK